MIYAGVLGILLLMLCVSAEGGEGRPFESGTYERVLKLADGRSLLYTLYVPKQLRDKRAPLVVALHYGGKNKDYYSREYLEKLVIPAYKDLGAVVVAPDCPADNWRAPESERAVLALLDHALKELPVDEKRVVVTGFSMGGIGTWFMAARHPERFCAAVALAARPADEPDGRVPFYVIHSKADELFPLAQTEQAVAKLQSRGGKVEFKVVDGITHFETSRFAAPLSGSVAWLNGIWTK